MRDDCDSASFNAVLGPGGCVGNGSTTFAEFNAALADHQFVGAWKFNPHQFEEKAGTIIEAENRGGETHSFTPVAAFGGGFVPTLNDASGNTTVAPECANPAAVTLVPSGGHVDMSPLTVGTHRFQCCIHPWMRATVTVRRES
jgi:plastocyanin